MLLDSYDETNSHENYIIKIMKDNFRTDNINNKFIITCRTDYLKGKSKNELN